MHFCFLTKLVAMRAMSLASCYLIPPFRHACALLDDNKARALAQMAEEWTWLLKAEAVCAAGHIVAPLDLMHFRLNTVVRLIYVARERDAEDALELLRTCTCHIGDSRLIEVVHQKAKDSLRDARHSQKSKVGKQYAVIRTEALKSRGIPEVHVSDADKVDCPSVVSDNFVKLTHPNSHVSCRTLLQGQEVTTILLFLLSLHFRSANIM